MKNTVRLLRREKHWSQDELAARVGVSRQCIEAIEKERFLPSITLAYNIAFSLGKYVLEVFPPQTQLRDRSHIPPAFAPNAKGCHSENPHSTRESRMIANALIVTVAVLLALGFWLMGELKFLVPYRSILYHQYGSVILAWIVVVFVNVFAAVYVIQRKFFLKDTGRKLSHLDKQVTAGHSPVPPPMGDEEH